MASFCFQRSSHLSKRNYSTSRSAAHNGYVKWGWTDTCMVFHRFVQQRWPQPEFISYFHTYAFYRILASCLTNYLVSSSSTFSNAVLEIYHPDFFLYKENASSVEMEWLDLQHIKEIFPPAEPQYPEIWLSYIIGLFFSPLYNQKAFSSNDTFFFNPKSLSHKRPEVCSGAVCHPAGWWWARKARPWLTVPSDNPARSAAPRCLLTQTAQPSSPRRARCLPSAIKCDSYTAPCQNRKNRSTLADSKF